MGGDHAPDEVVAGAGRVAGWGPRLRPPRPRPLPIEIVDAPEVIEMHESPAMAVRKKRRSSIHVMLQQIREGKAAAAISAGNTGAAMGAGLLTLGRIPTIDRPALAAILPTLQKTPAILLDVGADVDGRPKPP